MLKIFISQPMSKYTDEEVLKNRQDAIKLLNEFYQNDDFEVIDNIQGTNNEIEKLNHPNLGYLSNDIRDLAEADVAYFVDEWKTARGCRIEHLCASESGIHILYEEEVKKAIKKYKYRCEMEETKNE